MKTFLKSIGIIVLLFALVNPIYYAYVGHYVALKKIKKEVKTNLIFNTPKEDLVTFQFTIGSEKFKSLDWKHSQEFEFQGKMYDIVEADTVNDVVHYLCFPDKQETALNNEFKQLLNERYAKDEPTNNKQRMLSNFVKSLFLQESEEEKLFVVKINTEYNIHFKGIKPSEFIKMNSPPPQL